MKAIDYLKEKGRMTDNCIIYYCNECLLNSKNNNTPYSCGEFEAHYPEKAVEIVEKWAKENPVKTYLSVLLEKFPNTQFNGNKTPNFCPHNIFGETVMSKEYDSCDFGNMCVDCWNREYKEDTNV